MKGSGIVVIYSRNYRAICLERQSKIKILHRLFMFNLRLEPDTLDYRVKLLPFVPAY